MGRGEPQTPGYYHNSVSKVGPKHPAPNFWKEKSEAEVRGQYLGA